MILKYICLNVIFLYQIFREKNPMMIKAETRSQRKVVTTMSLVTKKENTETRSSGNMNMKRAIMLDTTVPKDIKTTNLGNMVRVLDKINIILRMNFLLMGIILLSVLM